MPFLDEKREYRYFQPLTPLLTEKEDNGFLVEGYATTWDPYTLFVDEEEGVEYKEQIMPGAFSDCDFSDCIFQFDHAGYVYARTRNKTLAINTDDKGLKIRADLSKTTHSREIYEDIVSGNVDRMSFAFVVGLDRWERNGNVVTRYIDSIRKCYDVSCVSLPANPGTEIGVATRSAIDGFISAEQEEFLKIAKRQKQLKRINLKLKLNQINGEN